MSNVKTETIELSRDFIEALEALKPNLGLSRFQNAEFSALFILQMFVYRENQIHNTRSITDEIKFLEGLSTTSMTKKTSQFQNRPLKGLWHKHYYQAQFMHKNIGNYWKINNNNQPKLSSMIVKTLKESKSESSTDKLAMKLAHEFIIGAYTTKSSEKSITGEWIIYAKHEGKNYYLSLDKHTKCREDDKLVYERIYKSCFMEFPFLFKSERYAS